jgi:hypothetical protein
MMGGTMTRKIAIVLALVAVAAMVVTPSQARARYKRYTISYTGGSTPGLSFKDNLADELQTTAIDGTALADTPLNGAAYGTPADMNIAGVTFEAGTFKGKPFKIIVKDDSGTPVSWSVCQELDGTPPCGGVDSTDVQQSGCGTPAKGAFLAGFQKGKDIGVWITLTDPVGINTGLGDTCDGMASTGRVTLITKL